MGCCAGQAAATSSSTAFFKSISAAATGRWSASRVLSSTRFDHETTVKMNIKARCVASIAPSSLDIEVTARQVDDRDHHDGSGEGESISVPANAEITCQGDWTVPNRRTTAAAATPSASTASAVG